MKCLKRNSRQFEYRAYKGVREILNNGLHTGQYEPEYEEPVGFRGNIAPASGYAANKLFGIGTDFTHVVVMDNPNTGITVNGIIDYNGHEHIVQAVRESLNGTTLAIKQRQDDMSRAVRDEEDHFFSGLVVRGKRNPGTE